MNQPSRSEWIQAADGVPLAATVYTSATQGTLGSVVIAGAVGVAQRRYQSLASFLSSQGWFVVTFDYRGLAGSRGSPEQFASATMQHWGERDLEAVLAWARTHLPGPRRVMLGHSIGGQLLGLASEHRFLDAAALIAVQRGYWAYWRGPFRYFLRAFWYAVPLLVRLFDGLPLELVGLERLPPKVALDWARWGKHRVYTHATGQPITPAHERVTIPLLAVSFEDDATYAPRETVDRLYQHHYRTAPHVRIHVVPRAFGFEQVGHSGFFFPERVHRVWWHELSNWLAHARATDVHAGLSVGAEHSLSAALVAQRISAPAVAPVRNSVWSGAAAAFESRLLARYRARVDAETRMRQRKELVELESGVVRVLKIGTGRRVIVMAPDPPNVVEHQAEVMRNLARDHTVYCFEMAGFGHSYLRPGRKYDMEGHCQLLGELFDHLRIRDATLSIACLSGIAAMSFAARRRDCVERMVLVQVPSLTEGRRWIRHADVFGMIRTPVLGQAVMHALRWKVLEQWYRSALPEPVDPELYRHLYTTSYQALAQGAGFSLGSAYQGLASAAPELPRDTPQLHLWGASDRTHARTLTDRRALLASAADAQLVEFEDCGHFPDLERAASYCDLVREFERGTTLPQVASASAE